ncbi:MAG: stage II sporulation protein M [Methanomicrobiaceae archaeon]|nr:stage II sporulation protein M [Methanomicrobiaceae archaeon]
MSERSGLFVAVLICSAIFAAAIVSGVAVTGLEGSIGDLAKEQVEQISEGLASQISGEGPLSLALLIFANNLRACIFLFLGGASFGVFTLIILGLNGALIGAIVQMRIPEKGALWVAAALIPHGIFEIPAILLSSGMGLVLAEELWLELQGSGDAARAAGMIGAQFVSRVIPLLAVAALIEAFITPQIVNVIL